MNLSKSQRLYFLAFMILVGAITYRLADLPPNQPEKSVKPIPPASKLSEKALSFAGPANAELSQEESQDETCRSFIEEVVTSSIDRLVEDIETQKLQFQPNCLFPKTTNLKNFENLQAICLPDSQGRLSQDCKMRLFLYKSLRIHQQTKDVSLADLSNELLIQKFFGVIAEESFLTEAGLQLFRTISLELMNRFPDSSSAAKASLLSYLMAPQLSESDRIDFQQLSEVARNQFPDDSDIFELSLFQKKLLSEDLYRQEVMAYYAQNSQAGIANYYMGCIAWNDGRVSEAQSFFYQASQNAPDHQNFRNTYERSLRERPPAQICAITINFNSDQF